jgi:hypothetical protein
VLLFFIFMVSHPLEGSRESSIKSLDIKAMNMLYGTDPVFIYDPINKTNSPVYEFHRNAIDLWPNYPSHLQRLFVRSFTDGLKDPANGRVRENEWRKALSKLRDSLFRCSHCKQEQFFDAEAGAGGKACTECKRIPSKPMRLRVDQSDIVVVLSEGRRLYEHHLLAQSDYKFNRALAQVMVKPSQPTVLGLKNLSNETWRVKASRGDETDVPPGKAIDLQADSRINFGQRVGIVRA